MISFEIYDKVFYKKYNTKFTVYDDNSYFNKILFYLTKEEKITRTCLRLLSNKKKEHSDLEKYLEFLRLTISFVNFLQNCSLSYNSKKVSNITNDLKIFSEKTEYVIALSNLLSRSFLKYTKSNNRVDLQEKLFRSDLSDYYIFHKLINTISHFIYIYKISEKNRIRKDIAKKELEKIEKDYKLKNSIEKVSKRVTINLEKHKEGSVNKQIRKTFFTIFEFIKIYSSKSLNVEKLKNAFVTLNYIFVSPNETKIYGMTSEIEKILINFISFLESLVLITFYNYFEKKLSYVFKKNYKIVNRKILLKKKKKKGKKKFDLHINLASLNDYYIVSEICYYAKNIEEYEKKIEEFIRRMEFVKITKSLVTYLLVDEVKDRFEKYLNSIVIPSIGNNLFRGRYKFRIYLNNYSSLFKKIGFSKEKMMNMVKKLLCTLCIEEYYIKTNSQSITVFFNDFDEDKMLAAFISNKDDIKKIRIEERIIKDEDGMLFL